MALSSSSDIFLFASVLAQFRGCFDHVFVEVVCDFLEKFSALRCHSSSLCRGFLDQFGCFELLEDFSDVVSACFRSVVGSDSEAFSSTVIRSEFF